VLYSHYGYRSGINERMRQNLIDIARIAENMAGLKKGDTVCDIGCNDGTFLEAISSKGVDRLGIDPAANVAGLARAKGLEVICDFFSKPVYEKARPGVKAKVIATIAMFYDLDDPSAFVRDIANILSGDGVWAMELAYLPSMLKNNSFDTICHEHLAYYGLRQLEWLFEKENLNIHRVEINDINGGSIRMFIRKRSAGPVPAETLRILSDIREKERLLRLDTGEPYSAFYQSVLAIRKELKHLLEDILAQGKRIYAYGASTKGNIILQFCGISNRLITKAADRNPDKWSCRTPATDIEIISEQQARDEKPDYFLVLPWSFIGVFKEREAAFLNGGGKFILPLPTVRVIGRNGEVSHD
jgi:hypothetical protein